MGRMGRMVLERFVRVPCSVFGVDFASLGAVGEWVDGEGRWWGFFDRVGELRDFWGTPGTGGVLWGRNTEHEHTSLKLSDGVAGERVAGGGEVLEEGEGAGADGFVGISEGGGEDGVVDVAVEEGVGLVGGGGEEGSGHVAADFGFEEEDVVLILGASCFRFRDNEVEFIHDSDAGVGGLAFVPDFVELILFDVVGNSEDVEVGCEAFDSEDAIGFDDAVDFVWADITALCEAVGETGWEGGEGLAEVGSPL